MQDDTIRSDGLTQASVGGLVIFFLAILVRIAIVHKTHSGRVVGDRTGRRRAESSERTDRTRGCHSRAVGEGKGECSLSPSSISQVCTRGLAAHRLNAVQARGGTGAENVLQGPSPRLRGVKYPT